MQVNLSIGGGNVYLVALPNKCPFCHQKIIPQSLAGHKRQAGKLDVFFKCPDTDCNMSFIGYYNSAGNNYFNWNGSTSVGSLNIEIFHDSISKISPSFSDIYNEAYQAEQYNLLEICGVGYRKSLEFLIKDYAITNNPEKADQIKKKPLASCIKDYISDERIKEVSKRAAWLGNDETHYVKTWDGKDLSDLKKLIKITLHWIEMEDLTKSIIDDMPE